MGVTIQNGTLASFTGDVELKDLNPPNSYKITGSGNSPVGFASGEASVKLEDENGGTKLIYEVEANVGGKIAQVGARLIDMTAKKMADIFFGKFSELITPSGNEEGVNQNQSEEKNSVDSSGQKPSNQKLLIYGGVVLAVAIIAYLIF